MAKMESYTALDGAIISCRRIGMHVSPFIFPFASVGCVVSRDHLTQRGWPIIGLQKEPCWKWAVFCAPWIHPL